MSTQPTQNEPLDAVSLFSGVGGIDLAARRVGMRTRLVCEKDELCRSVLARHFPEAVIHPDVTELTADDIHRAGAIPERTVVFAGWPCQGNSSAGHRAGMADERSGLWREVQRVLAEFRPRWFIGENVDGLLSVHRGRDLATVLQELAELGYGWAYRVLDAQFFGVPQRRRRVVIVGHLGDAGAAAPVEILFEPESSGRHHPPRRTTGQGVAATLTAGVSASRGVSRPGRRREDDINLVVSALDTQQGGPDDNSAQAGHLVVTTLGETTHALTAEGADASEDGTGRGTPLIAFAWQAGGNNSASGAFKDDGSTPCLPRSQTLAVGDGEAVRRLTPLECERLQGFPDGWTEGQSDAARYKQMGNSVAVPVFEWVLRRLAAHDQALECVA